MCIGTQSDNNVCGYTTAGFPGNGPYIANLPCHNVIIQSTTRNGTLIYKRVLGGRSEDLPRHFFFDAQDNVILLGTTWSSDFPTTPDAFQPAYAGPPPVVSFGPPRSGGDLFLSVLDSAGNLVYSTLIGSSGSDDIFDVQATPHASVDVLVSAGAGDFPVVPADVEQPSSGLVLLRISLNRRTIVRSAYLPIGPPAPYTAMFGEHGSVAVVTSERLYTFSRAGRPRTSVSLESFAFDSPPVVSADPAGDLWLLGATNGAPLVTKLAGGTVEVFRWILPIHDAFLLPPFFVPDGLTYFGGVQYILFDDTNLLTTPNALLTAPCSTSPGVVAALSPQGDVRLLSYLPVAAKSFALNPDGSVSVILNDGRGTAIPVDMNSPPSAACALDGLGRLFYQAFGVGQTVRILGGGFGPDSPVTVTPGGDQIYPVLLGGLQVQVNGIAAPILSAARGQVVFQIPFGTPEGDAVPVTVQDQGQQSVPLPIRVRTLSPLVTSILNEDGKPNSYDAPASPGSTVTLLFTGMGPYTPPLADGEIASSDMQRHFAQPVTLTFQTSASKLDPGSILYAGPVPGSVGQSEVKVQLPPSGPSFFSEDFPTLTIGSVSMQLAPSIIVK